MGTCLSCTCFIDDAPVARVSASVGGGEVRYHVGQTNASPPGDEYQRYSSPQPANIRQLPPVYDGLTIIVQGTIHPGANGFAVNLCTGPNYGQCDTALHINPRYNQNNVVVRNSFLNGAWGTEERGGAPFHVPQGSQLECLLLVQGDVIKVAFNGVHYCEYRHRLPKERINHIVVSGDMTLSNISFYGPAVPPTPNYGGLQATAPGGGYGYPVAAASSAYPTPIAPYHPGGGAAIQAPSGYPTPGVAQPIPGSTPGKQFVPGGLFPGRLVYITATPGPTQFAVNLRHQDGVGDIAFHFNPRLKDGVVVRNSNLGGTWGTEERAQPSFPFQAGQQFQMIILCEQAGFKVAVNGQHFVEFKSRTNNLQAIQWVEVVADANVANIFVQ